MKSYNRSRNRLHKSKLEDFTKWLETRGWVKQITKDYYEVLRMVKGKETLLIHTKLELKEHYTTWGASNTELNIWLRERKRKHGKK